MEKFMAGLEAMQEPSEARAMLVLKISNSILKKRFT
jgi:hypothetical protein